MNASPFWSVPLSIEDVPPTGSHLHLVADEEARARIAHATGLRDLPRLEASFDIVRRGEDTLSVVGEVSGTAGQNCVVTLEPVDNEIVEPVDLLFTAQPQASMSDEDGKATLDFSDAEPPEPLTNGTVDLGALATEYFLLGLDPYPRKAGAEFEPPAQDRTGESPFAVLAALKKRESGEGG
jgi:uncharacterized metal-binding protein YceD (DUF177 family)